MTFASFSFLANFIARQNLNPIIAIGINKIAKATENNTTEVTTITSSNGMAINLRRFEDLRIAQRDVEIKVTAYYS